MSKYRSEKNKNHYFTTLFLSDGVSLFSFCKEEKEEMKNTTKPNR